MRAALLLRVALAKTAHEHTYMAAAPPPGPLDYSHSHPCVALVPPTTGPLRVPLALLKGKWRARVCGAKRPTWNPRFEAYVTALRRDEERPAGRGPAAGGDVRERPRPLITGRSPALHRTIDALRTAPSWPSSSCWPRAATPMAELSRKWSTTSAQTTPDVVRTTEFRELLRTAPALVLVHGPPASAAAAPRIF